MCVSYKVAIMLASYGLVDANTLPGEIVFVSPRSLQDLVQLTASSHPCLFRDCNMLKRGHGRSSILDDAG
jgi:hypothetical protein